MFKVGDKVVCVKKGKWTYEDTDPSFIKFPRHGMILTVRKTSMEYGKLYLFFEEIVNPNEYMDLEGEIIKQEPSFYSERFRKLDHKPFTNELTKELALKQITEQTEESVDVPEKELEEV